jgi:hypothetical protein
MDIQFFACAAKEVELCEGGVLSAVNLGYKAGA